MEEIKLQGISKKQQAKEVKNLNRIIRKIKK